MHESVQRWVPTVLTPDVVKGRTVLEVGSYDVNGSIRPSVEAHEPAEYIGVDFQAGPRVDMVVRCEELTATFGRRSFDVVVSTEMLEHARDWRTCITEMASVTRDVLVVTTRSRGFPYHGYPDDFWRFSHDQLTDILCSLGFAEVTVSSDPQVPGVFGVARRPGTPGPLDHIHPTTPLRREA